MDTEFQQTLTQLGFPLKSANHAKETTVEVEGATSTATATSLDIQGLSSTRDKVEQRDSVLEGGGKDQPGCDKEMMVESEVEELDPEPEIVDNIERFHWTSSSIKPYSRESSNNPLGDSLWGALSRTVNKGEGGDSFYLSEQMMQSSECQWDRLFAADSATVVGEETGNGGIEQLLQLFINSSCPDPSQQEEVEAGATETTETASMSMLSQGCQEVVRNIYSDIDTNTTKLSALNQVCPDWRENVAYAFAQEDEGEILQALDNLKRSRSKMSETKKRILESWGRHQMALDLFETSLEESLSRLKSKGPSSAKVLKKA